ncbi:MAG: XdhC family protein [Pseudomonadota bacterium]
MSKLKLIRQFQHWAGTKQDLVLATVVETRGHTYSKPGGQMVICGHNYQGMVSGGCLEGDIAEHAQRVLATGEASLLCYDLRSNAENELIGLGVGCEGEIDLLLQKLSPNNQYQPLSALVECYQSKSRLDYQLVIDSNRSDVAIGESLLLDENSAVVWGNPKLLDLQGLKLFSSSFAPLPRILVLGAGIDARPLIELAAATGWLVSVSDNRPAMLDALASFDTEHNVRCLPEQLADKVDLGCFDAVVVMSHHLEKDKQYLKTVCESSVPYIGVLGPVSRTRRLLKEAGLDFEDIKQRLKSPIGLDIGANSPETIALSIMSEVQAHHCGRDGASLTRG